jgi:hypothetical protein
MVYWTWHESALFGQQAGSEVVGRDPYTVVRSYDTQSASEGYEWTVPVVQTR